MKLDNKNIQKFSVLFFLYIAQAIPMSFFSTIVPVIMRQENYSLELIGFVQMVKLPWIAKFLWAPVVDRYANVTSHYRKWIFSSEIFYAVIIFSIGFLDLQTNFVMIIALVVIAFIASATQDIATDAYAILLLKKEERGFGNSMQSAGSFAGTVIGSGVLLVIYHYFGWTWLLHALAVFVLIALIPLFFYKKNGQIVKPKTTRASGKDIISFFSQKGIIPHILLLFFFYSGIIGILAMLKPYLVDIGFDTKKIGIISGLIGTGAAGITALAAGWLIKKLERTTVMKIYLFCSLTIALFFVCITYQPFHSYFIYIGIVFLWMTYGLSTVTIYTTAMDRVRPGKEGTDFTIQIVLTHLSSLIIATQSGWIAGSLGYRGLFYIEAVLVLITFIILSTYKTRIKKHERIKIINPEI